MSDACSGAVAVLNHVGMFEKVMMWQTVQLFVSVRFAQIFVGGGNHLTRIYCTGAAAKEGWSIFVRREWVMELWHPVPYECFSSQKLIVRRV